MISGVKEMYYGTGNDNLGTYNIPFDPEFKSNAIFEFGHGFYLAEKKSTAETYAKRAFIDKQKQKFIQTYNSGKIVLLSNINYTIKSYIHIFQVNFDSLNNYPNRIINNYTDMEQNLHQVLKGYNTNKYYAPCRTWTYGYLAGPEFDKLINVTNYNTIKKSTAIRLSIINRIKDNQLCIHKRLNSTKNGNMRYLNDLIYVNKLTLDRKYFEKKKKVAYFDKVRAFRKTIISGIYPLTRYNRRIGGGND